MHILIIKTTSLGDLVHLLPALSDAAASIPGLRVDWLVEESFAAVPAWHPAVDQVIPIAIRRWRKHLAQRDTWRELAQARQRIQARRYDAVIDAQGLIKSALFAVQALGTRWGYDRTSIREPLACLAYQHRATVSWSLHAIERNRRLLSAALGYRWEALPLNYGLRGLAQRVAAPAVDLPPRYVVGLHGTSRPDKEWDESQWVALGLGLAHQGVSLVLPWGNAREHERAQRMGQQVPGSVVLPKLGLDALAYILDRATAVVGVDTGLMHIAAALDKPGVALFPVTDPGLYGVRVATGAPPMVNLSHAPDLVAQRVLQELAPSLGSLG